MDVCSLCRCTLKSTGQRRKLHGTSLTHVVAILQEFVGELWTAASETLFHPEAFLCRPCMRNLEKLRKLGSLLRDKEDEIRQLVNRAMDAHGLVLGSAFSSPTGSVGRPAFSTPVRKRSGVAADTESPTSTVKRPRYDTPTRDSLSRMVPTEESPAILYYSDN